MTQRSLVTPDFSEGSAPLDVLEIALCVDANAEQVCQLAKLFDVLGDAAYEHGHSECKMRLGSLERYFGEEEWKVFKKKASALFSSVNAISVFEPGDEGVLRSTEPVRYDTTHAEAVTFEW